MNESPKVSVIMGIYNCEGTLARAIDSIIEQTYPNWELVLCDDGSTDGTYALAETYRQRYPERIILLRNETNRKLSFTLNRCLREASGDLIARMDGDDYSHKDRLLREVEFLQSHPELQLVGTAMQTFDRNGFRIVRHPPAMPDKSMMGKITPFFHATILTYKSVFETLNGYCELKRAERVEDVDLFFRFFHAGFRGGNIDEILYYVQEDYDTLKRRTIQNRINAFQTLAYGYDLSGFSKRELIKPAILTVAKSLVPVPVIKWIKNKSEGNSRRN